MTLRFWTKKSSFPLTKGDAAWFLDCWKKPIRSSDFLSWILFFFNWILFNRFLLLLFLTLYLVNSLTCIKYKVANSFLSFEGIMPMSLNRWSVGCLGYSVDNWLLIKYLPSCRIGSWSWGPGIELCVGLSAWWGGKLLLPLPLTLCLLTLSLSNKFFKILKKFFLNLE